MFKKIRQYEIFSIAVLLFTSLFILNFVYAQEVKTVNDTNLRTNTTETTTIKTDSDVTESLKTVSENLNDIRISAEETEKKIRTEVKNAIDKNIINIRKETSTPAYELQKAIDEDRTDLYESLNTTLKNVNIENAGDLDSFSKRIEDGVNRIEKTLESKSGLKADFTEETRSIRNTILKFIDVINEKKRIIENREGDKIYKDTDDDGLSDYDEEYIYGTDPKNPSTNGDGETDGAKVASGRDPKTGENISYADPRTDEKSYVTQNYSLENIALIKQEEKDLIKFEGRAIPNSFVTLYIYSTPIIVTVKTDSNGDWNYELDKELEDGEHQLYVATVNNSGKIIARSNPISFTKTAEAASIGIVGVDIETSQAGDFFRDNFILISLAALIAIVVFSLMLIGREKSVTSTVNNLRSELDDKDK